MIQLLVGLIVFAGIASIAAILWLHELDKAIDELRANLTQTAGTINGNNETIRGRDRAVNAAFLEVAKRLESLEHITTANCQEVDKVGQWAHRLASRIDDLEKCGAVARVALLDSFVAIAQKVDAAESQVSDFRATLSALIAEVHSPIGMATRLRRIADELSPPESTGENLR